MKTVISQIWTNRPSIPEFVAAFLGTLLIAAIVLTLSVRHPALALSPTWLTTFCSLPPSLFAAIWFITALSAEDENE